MTNDQRALASLRTTSRIEDEMEKLSKTSLNYYLSEYLSDLWRAGVKDAPRASRAAAPAPGRAPTRNAPQPPPPRQAPASIGAARPVREHVAQDPQGESGKKKELLAIAKQVASCTLCDELVANRTQTVFGSGNPDAELMFIGEGPGAEEDLRGEPFVGRSGKLLTDMIEKGMGIPRSSVFICNVVRCRPPGNRNPSPEEAQACRPFLDATFQVVQPKFVCCLGSIAATNLLNTTLSIGKLRGRVHDYLGAKVVCTYHPAYLLRNPGAKKDAWEDLKLLMAEMGLKLPGAR